MGDVIDVKAAIFLVDCNYVNLAFYFGDFAYVKLAIMFFGVRSLLNSSLLSDTI
jgi:hypothetical protein